ncbi:MAG: hypothetical protein Q8Q06_01260 [bacterium]|nr:hypothetical protein [bacterium]
MSHTSLNQFTIGNESNKGILILSGFFNRALIEATVKDELHWEYKGGGEYSCEYVEGRVSLYVYEASMLVSYYLAPASGSYAVEIFYSALNISDYHEKVLRAYELRDAIYKQEERKGSVCSSGIPEKVSP